jgi:uncharacterized membrane protein
VAYNRKENGDVNESKYTDQTQAACPIVYPLSDLGQPWRRSGYRFGPSSSVWRFNQWLTCCTGFHLWHWMVPQGLLTWLAWNQMNRRSTWGVIGLTLFGATTFIGAVGEPITYELLNPVTFNPLLAVIQAGMIIIPLVMMVFAIQEWRRRRSETKQKENTTQAALRI